MTGSVPPLPAAPGQRGDLLARLVDAAEIEHGLLLQYLFAAFAIKQRTDEGLTALELERVRAWKRVILEVAREEMAHLATVCNLQLAIGAVPHLRPPGLPAVNRHFGAQAPFRLAALSPETIDRFVFFERPEGDGRAGPAVGTLYRAIQRDLAELDAHGGLFVVQGQPEDVDLWGVSGTVRFGRIGDLASAVRAIEAVIEQGEGEAAGEASHYARFRRVARELREAGLDPSRPVTGRPGACDDPLAQAVDQAFAAVYGALLAVLARYYDAVAAGRPEALGLRRLSRPLMSVLLRPLGEWLTDLPAGPGEPGRRAAPAFAPREPEAADIGATLRREAGLLAPLGDPRAAPIAENLELAAREADALAGRR